MLLTVKAESYSSNFMVILGHNLFCGFTGSLWHYWVLGEEQRSCALWISPVTPVMQLSIVAAVCFQYAWPISEVYQSQWPISAGYPEAKCCNKVQGNHFVLLCSFFGLASVYLLQKMFFFQVYLIRNYIGQSWITSFLLHGLCCIHPAL